MKSWIKLHRKIREWGWYSNPITKSVFIELLLIANWKKSQWNGVDLDVGDAVIGRKVLAERLGISEQNVRTALKHLEKTNEITKKTAGAYTVVHLNNFADYQNTDEENSQFKPTQYERRAIQPQQSENPERTIRYGSRLVL